MFGHFSKGLILSLLAGFASTAYADVVAVGDARQLAADFLMAGNSGDQALNVELELVSTVGPSSMPYYYVFNVGADHGYVIVSADDSTAPILGYSTEGHYDEALVPPAMKWMMSGLEREIKAAPSLNSSYTADQRRRMVRRSGRSGERILLPTAAWSQEAPFNNSIPGHRLVGCVGTAMSIIMKYHAYPEHGFGSYNNVSFDVDYDWENMRTDNYRQGYSQAEADAVATLMYHASSSIDTQYAMSGSSAYEVRVPAALTNYFGYDPGVTYRKRSEFSTQAAFDAIVIEEIKNNRPVLYCGQDVTVGHAFVVDGYDPMTGMLHINWGWGGADGNFNGGWYASTALDPTVSQTHHFNNLTTIIYNIKRGNGDNSAWSPIHLTSEGGQPGIGSDMEALDHGKTFTVRAGTLKNVSYSDYKGKIAVALYNATGDFKTLLSEPKNFSLASLVTTGYVDFYNCSLPAAASVAEGDMLRVATSTDGESWLPVPGELLTENEIAASCTSPATFSVTFPSGVAGVTYSGEPAVIKGWNYGFTVTPSDPAEDVVTVKANGVLLTPANGTYNYTIDNVREDQLISILVQKASEVKAKRSVWVENPGQLSSIITPEETGTITELTLFGSIDATDFDFMRKEMNLTRLDISSVYIAANGSNQANAIPRSAFQGKWSLKEVILPRNINRINNSAFRQCGITSITIPAGVSTYEYNIFLGSTALRDIWVGREKAEFVNWCVFSGTRTDLMTLHVPNQNAVNNYSAKEYWKDIKNIVIDPIPAQDDFAFAVMEDADVKYDSQTLPGRYAKGTTVNFTAEHIADNDNRMAVYANSTPLTPDAQGVYSVTLNSNTIVHFDLIKPMEVAVYDSPWKITTTGGSVGMFTDAVNVIPGKEFSFRTNGMFVPADANNLFWAAVLTDSEGRIKEFITPVSNWNGTSGDGLRFTLNCCVRESNVREGNYIRLVTSYNKKTWALVKGATEDAIDRLPALNNQTPVYNMTFSEGLAEKANISGIGATAVRGRDINMKVTPRNASHMLDAVVNGDTIVKGAKSFSYSFIAMQDMDFDINVYPPVVLTEATIVLGEGEHFYYHGTEDGGADWGVKNKEIYEKYRNVQNLKIIGKLDYYDFNFFRENYWVAENIRKIDLSEATIVRDRDKDAKHGFDNYFPSYAFYNPKHDCWVEEIILPESVTQFGHDAFKGCSRLKEIRLPKGLRNWGQINAIRISTGEVMTKTGSGMEDDVFLGCNSLETIYLPCAPGEGGNVGHLYYSQYHALKTGLPDNKKVTVVVPEEHVAAYRTPHVDNGYFDNNWSNGWEAGGFNIVGEYPVYSLNYDASRCFVADPDLDVSKAASFLRDNISLESLTLSDKLYVGALSNAEERPEGVDPFNGDVKVRIYNNGHLLPEDAVGEDGSVSLTFWNPNKNPEKSGNQNISVLYLYDVAFNCASDQFKVSVPELRNDEAEKCDEATLFEEFDLTDPVAPVLRNVTEGNTVRFSVGLSTENPEIAPRVKVGEQVLVADEEGYYSVSVDDSDVKVEVYAVPSNGATLTKEDIVSINTEEAADVTEISLEGDIDSETLAIVVNGLGSLESLDMSGMTSEIPSNAFEGNETIKEVTLPEVESIQPNTFKDCKALENITIPETVSNIGEGAFSGCSSLESVTLSGIDVIGSGAFNGCDNMTTITLNASNSELSGGVLRAPRAAGIAEDAFAGVNPNCMIILGEGVARPAGAGHNCITTRVGEIPDINEAGEETVRQGRIYESAGDISLVAGYPFDLPNSFTMIDGNSISCSVNVPAAGVEWHSLMIPFAPTAVTCGGVNLVAKTEADQKSESADYMVASLENGTNEFMLRAGVQANVPMLVKQTVADTQRELLFSASDVVVPATPESISVEGLDFTVAGGYRGSQLPAATTYVLDADSRTFVKADADYSDVMPEDGAEEIAVESTVEVAPFEVYATSEVGLESISISVAGDDIETGISEIQAADGDFSIFTSGDNIIIIARKAVETALFDVDGHLVGTIRLNPGRNVIGGLGKGLYIVAGQKVML